MVQIKVSVPLIYFVYTVAQLIFPERFLENTFLFVQHLLAIFHCGLLLCLSAFMLFCLSSFGVALSPSMKAYRTTHTTYERFMSVTEVDSHVHLSAVSTRLYLKCKAFYSTCHKTIPHKWCYTNDVTQMVHSSGRWRANSRDDSLLALLFGIKKLCVLNIFSSEFTISFSSFLVKVYKSNKCRTWIL